MTLYVRAECAGKLQTYGGHSLHFISPPPLTIAVMCRGFLKTHNVLCLKSVKYKPGFIHAV